MSQSEQHRSLVIRIAEVLISRYPKISITTDIQQNPGDDVPPLIGGFRPDVYARLPTDPSLIIIAEAKTDQELYNNHKYYNAHLHDQVSAFITRLEQIESGTLILSVTGWGANYAKTFLRYMHQTHQPKSTTLCVFDDLDLWCLDSESGIKWHLS